MRGKLTDSVKLPSVVIPTIKENPIKCLGKWRDDTLRDRNSTEVSGRWVPKEDCSGQLGKFKSWIYQDGPLPWLMAVKGVAVERLKKRVNQHLRKWLGIPPSVMAVELYIWSGKLQFLLSHPPVPLCGRRVQGDQVPCTCSNNAQRL